MLLCSLVFNQPNQTLIKMKQLRTTLLFTSLSLMCFLSCRKNPVTTVQSTTPCQLTGLTQYESVNPQEPGSGTVYKENELVYEGDFLTRINTKTRGVTDGYRTITYHGSKVKTVTFFNKDHAPTYAYNFIWNNQTGRLDGVGVEYHTVSPSVSAAYAFDYDDQGRLGKSTYYHQGAISQVIEYTYGKVNDTTTAVALVYQLSSSDPAFKLKIGIHEYYYDDKRHENLWPAFAWNQNHQAFLDLIAPPSAHNLVRYTAKIPRSLSAEVPVYDVDPSVSFTAAITYSAQGFPLTISETRLSGNALKYAYAYANCAQ